jgi:hypothetical protein
MAVQAAYQQALALLAVQVVVRAITAVQQVAQQGHQDRGLPGAITSARPHIQPAAAAAHLRLAQMQLDLHLARGAQARRLATREHL